MTVATNAILQLNFAEMNTVAALVLNGVSLPAGIYSATTDPTYLAGTGSLQVGSSLPGQPDEHHVQRQWQHLVIVLAIELRRLGSPDQRH